MKSRSIAGFVVMASMLLAAQAIRGQMKPGLGERHMMDGMRQGMGHEEMMEQCQEMMRHMNQMRERVEKMNHELEERLETLEQAEGGERIAALEGAVRTLARQRIQMDEQKQQMMHRMMHHMGEHMMMKGKEGDREEMMMRCPMMQPGAMEDKSPNKEDHDKHH
jgi:hypothetical protein